jgi:phosphoesterase RecJ-like protein
MTKNDISEIKRLLGTPKNIVIVPHKNPDGDAMGSTLGLSHYLKRFGHNADVIAPNNYPEFLKWIPGDDQVIIYESEVALGNQKIENADIIFTLDFNALNRTGDMEMPLKNSSSLKILIDHHQQPDGYAKYQYSDVAMSSTSEMVYHFIDMLDDLDKINSEIATCLYVGIMTDTGSFRFSSTTSVTHRVIADLIDKGANNSQIHINVYDTSSFNRLQLLGRALNNLKVIPEFNTAYIVLAQEDLNEFNFKRGDTEGVVNYALSIKGVKFALIFIEQKKEGIIKISLRSKQGFDVNKFARAHFNGGGHINAAGGRSELSLNETTTLLHKLLPNYKEDLTT